MNLLDQIPADWREFLRLDTNDTKSALIRTMLDHVGHRLRHGGTYCPPSSLIFRALDEVSPEDVRLVILGQDPYPQPGKARGVAFGYHPDYPGSADSSLSNIKRELRDDVGVMLEDTSLRGWTKQGVLLLNTRLTVLAGKPMSHAGLGWELLTGEILRQLEHHRSPVFLSWGSEARRFVTTYAKPTDWRRHVGTSHPCRYSADKGFLGSSCFSEVNRILGQAKAINWGMT